MYGSGECWRHVRLVTSAVTYSVSVKFPHHAHKARETATPIATPLAALALSADGAKLFLSRLVLEQIMTKTAQPPLLSEPVSQ